MGSEREEAREDEARLKNDRDWYSLMSTAEQKGRVKGRMIGLAIGEAIGLAMGEAIGRAERIKEGERKKQLEIARTMKSLKIDPKVIAKATGLTLEEIAEDVAPCEE